MPGTGAKSPDRHMAVVFWARTYDVSIDSTVLPYFYFMLACCQLVADILILLVVATQTYTSGRVNGVYGILRPNGKG